MKCKWKRGCLLSQSYGTPAYDFSGLLDQLGTMTRQHIRLGATTFLKVTIPTPLQQHAFSLLGVPITV